MTTAEVDHLINKPLKLLLRPEAKLSTVRLNKEIKRFRSSKQASYLQVSVVVTREIINRSGVRKSVATRM